MSPYERKVGHFQKMCPECGMALKARRGSTGHRFLGCSGYPKCRYTQPI
jgi:DNA topoisomerase-1